MTAADLQLRLYDVERYTAAEREPAPAILAATGGPKPKGKGKGAAKIGPIPDNMRDPNGYCTFCNMKGHRTDQCLRRQRADASGAQTKGAPRRGSDEGDSVSDGAAEVDPVLVLSYRTTRAPRPDKSTSYDFPDMVMVGSDDDPATGGYGSMARTGDAATNAYGRQARADISGNRRHEVLLDSGATVHVTPCRSHLHEYQELADNESKVVEVMGGAIMPILGKGKMYLRNAGTANWIEIPEVYHVPAAQATYLSPSRFGKQGVVTTLGVNKFTLRSHRHGKLLTGTHRDDKYVLEPLELATGTASTRERGAPTTRYIEPFRRQPDHLRTDRSGSKARPKVMGACMAIGASTGQHESKSDQPSPATISHSADSASGMSLQQDCGPPPEQRAPQRGAPQPSGERGPRALPPGGADDHRDNIDSRQPEQQPTATSSAGGQPQLDQPENADSGLYRSTRERPGPDRCVPGEYSTTTTLKMKDAGGRPVPKALGANATSTRDANKTVNGENGGRRRKRRSAGFHCRPPANGSPG